MKLLEFKKSTNPKKKWMAVFIKDTGRTKTTHFGDAKMEDYTQHHDRDRRNNYLSRHGGGKETWSDPTTAGSLSRYILWGDSTSLSENLKNFKSRFSL